MEVTIDKFGRILIPKKVREMLGLKPGQVLELITDQTSRKLNLRLPAESASMEVIVTDFGLPVIQNGPPTEEPFDTVEFIKETREEYLNRKMGL
jgi:AbrB family looped-hinge helix DNA binding protein